MPGSIIHPWREKLRSEGAGGVGGPVWGKEPVGACCTGGFTGEVAGLELAAATGEAAGLALAAATAVVLVLCEVDGALVPDLVEASAADRAKGAGCGLAEGEGCGCDGGLAAGVKKAGSGTADRSGASGPTSCSRSCALGLIEIALK